MNASDRSAEGLREALFEAIDDLRNGKIEASQAKAIANLAAGIIKSVELQLKFEELRLDSKVPASLPSMPLVPKLKAIGK